MSDFLAGLSCFISFFLAAAFIGILGWARGRFRNMQQQVDLLKLQVKAAQQAAPPMGAPSLTASAAAAPPITAPSSAALPSTASPEILPGAEAVEATVTPAISVTLPASPTAESAQPVTQSPVPALPSPKAPAKPNPLIAWFTQMNIMVQIGLIVLFFGVAFLVKYASDQGWLSIELRLTGAALLGATLAGVGWRLRHKSRGYGLALIGGGIGIVYITTFAAYRIYALIPAPLAFALLVALGAAYALMALLNDAQILAFLALVGGLLAPILASSGGGSHVMLFSYYFVVNAGILAIAWFKSWRLLNLSSFVLVLLAALGWGSAEYQPSLFNSTEPFLVLFFLFYLTISLLTLRRALATAEGNHFGISDVIVLFANPLASFALQYPLINSLGVAGEGWLARSALALALIYAALALWSNRSWRVANLSKRWLLEPFIFLATFFLAFSIPLLYDERVTAASWAVLGVALHWLAVRRRQGWAHFWGVIVRLAATAAFVTDMDMLNTVIPLDRLPLFNNPFYIGALILSLSALLSAWLLHGEDERSAGIYRKLGGGMLLWGLLWWFGSGVMEMGLHIRDEHYVLSSIMAFVALSCVAAELIGTWLHWQGLRRTLLVMLPLLTLLALGQWGLEESLLRGGNWYAWPLAVAAIFFSLKRFEAWQSSNQSSNQSASQSSTARWLAIYHAGAVWLVTFWLARLGYQFMRTRTEVDTWHLLPLLLIPGAMLALVGIFPTRLPVPMGNHPRWYDRLAALPLAIFLVLASLWVSIDASGMSDPLPYVPLINPLTLTLLALLVVLFGWLRQVGEGAAQWLGKLVWLAKLAWGVLAFVVFNAALARDIHHLMVIPFDWSSLFASEILQTTYAIVWSIIALVLMIWANRKGKTDHGWAAVWFFGAAVLALTVLKLFIIDLANTGAIARIVSFMGVGLLIIIIAYYAPVSSTLSDVRENETNA